MRNGTAHGLAELDLDKAFVALADVLHELVKLVRQLAIVELATLGGLADGEPLNQPFRVGLDDDTSKVLGFWRTLLWLGGDVGVNLLESGDGCADLGLAAAEVLLVDEDGLVVRRVVLEEYAASSWGCAFAADRNDDRRLVPRGRVAAFDGATELAWSQGERLLVLVRFRLEWLRLLGGARLGNVLVLEALGERNDATASGPGHLCRLRGCGGIKSVVGGGWLFVVSKGTRRQIPLEDSVIL